MALYRENATGFIQEWATNPGATHTAITAQPTDTLANRVTWWRNVDKGSQASSWHPSEYRTPQDPAEAVLSMSFSKDAAFFSADHTGLVTDAYLGGSCTVRVTRGGSDVTDSEGWALTKVDDGCTSTLTKSGGVWTLTITNVPLLATKSGYVRVTATRAGSTTQVRDWNWLKVQNGSNGTNGTNGTRGSRQILVTTADGVWSDLTAWNGIVTQTGTTPVLSDLVTIAKTDGTVATSKFCTGNSASPGTWTTPTAYINGSLLVTGSVGANQIAANSITADRIDSRGLSIKDSSGNVILAAGTPLTGDYIPAGGANLLRAPVTWTPVGSTGTGTGERNAVDGTYLRFPASAPILQYTDSPSMTLAAGTYTLSLKCYNGAGTGDQRTMAWQVLTGSTLIVQDAKVLSGTVARYALSFTLTTTTTLYVRVFCGTTSAREARAFDLKIESGSAMTPWVSHAADQIGINNPITAATASTFIADATITAAQIANATITAAQIANATITAAKIANATITNAQIADATITSAKIVSLSATKLTAGTIDANTITVTNLNASNITGGTLSVDRISANSINGSKIGTGTNGVDTPNIRTESVNTIISGGNFTSVTPPYGSWITVTDVTLPANANRGNVILQCVFSMYISSGARVDLRVLRNGSGFEGTFSGKDACILFEVDSSSPTSATVYTFQVLLTNLGSAPATFTRALYLSVTDVKR